jgi:F-type H+-transporting ATPase subunit a
MSDFFPHVVFSVLGIPVRNTVVATWIMMALVVSLAIIVGRRRPMALEMLVDFINDALTDVMRRPASPFLPLLASLAIFIAFANIMGVIPFMVSPTRDINTTLALAVVVFFAVHFYGIRAKGVLTYFKDLATPIYTLPLEIIGQLSRTVSLTLRLFGNIVSGELVVAVIFGLAPLFLPLPLVFFSMFTGVLQAYIFASLAAVYIAAGVDVIGDNVPASLVGGN